MRLQRDVDFSQFLRGLRREGRPSYLPFYEHVASSGFIAERTGTRFDRMGYDDEGFWRIYVDFWLGMGYDCVPMEIPLNCRVVNHLHTSSWRPDRTVPRR